MTYDAVYVQLQEQAFDYQGFFGAPVAGQPFVNVPFSQTAWDTLCYSNQGDPVTVTLVFSSGGVAYGPITETWTIAQGTLTGTVYYNSYGTALAINYPGGVAGPPFGGATLAIKHGATSPRARRPASAPRPDRPVHALPRLPLGRRRRDELVTQHGDDYEQSSAYALTSGNAETVMPPCRRGPPPTPSVPGGLPGRHVPLEQHGPLPGTAPPATSGLFSILRRAPPSPPPGLPAGLGAATPAFSPDGTHVAFNYYSSGPGVSRLPSISTRARAPSRTSRPSTRRRPGRRPTLPGLPSDQRRRHLRARAVQRRVSSARRAHTGEARGELWWVDLKTHTAAPLSTLNGVGYLPAGANNHGQGAPDGASLENDTTLQYEPTVNPVPSGGYAWVVFTSRRMYGNVATQDPFLSDPRNYNATLSATTKKLWVAAIDLNATPGTDPSHPAFYLPAQELLAGNSRGYWVVDPCEPSGASCLTGDQCCTGYCGEGDGGMVCGTQPPGVRSARQHVRQHERLLRGRRWRGRNLLHRRILRDAGAQLTVWVASRGSPPYA